ncbi:hypothetical protein [Acidipropionibacterium jensenii]|nr:hypothetical protein [Acidipropionibacterium jensenii]
MASSFQDRVQRQQLLVTGQEGIRQAGIDIMTTHDACAITAVRRVST